ncbi:hypothetical protein QTO30_19465 [Yoonia sp. GPGPB17]|uniref:imm11 family protein n=1 Tax=Yoonia sp. GPGPB17 TaxID=3026147 RepID=UPI0030BF45DB
MPVDPNADAYYVNMDILSSPEFEFENYEGFMPFYRFGCSAKYSDVKYAPKSAIQMDRRKTYNDIMAVSGAFVVSDRFRAIIEDTEPGVHDFFPIEMKKKDGSPLGKNYYLVSIRQYCICILPQLSACSKVKRTSFSNQPYQTCSERKLVLSRPAIKDMQIFITSVIAGGYLIVSQAVGRRLIEEKIKRLDLYPVTLSDEVWDFDTHAPEAAEWYRENPEEWENQQARNVPQPL